MWCQGCKSVSIFRTSSLLTIYGTKSLPFIKCVCKLPCKWHWLAAYHYVFSLLLMEPERGGKCFNCFAAVGLIRMKEALFFDCLMWTACETEMFFEKFYIPRTRFGLLKLLWIIFSMMSVK